jgi:undecaprenyl-diphosphatase
MLTYAQSIIMGLLQGITELFPISSLGHSVLLPTVVGWNNLVKAQTDQESFFLSFLVGLHLATAIALLIFYRREWARIVAGFGSSLKKRRATTPNERLAWLLMVATIPIALAGLAFEHSFRVIFAKPLFAAIFLAVNGLLLLAVERFIRRRPAKPAAESLVATEQNLSSLTYRDAGIVGIFQIGALFAGISRSGVTLAAGLWRGLNHQDAARFSFLLATPIVLLAGLYKLPDLLGHNGNGVRGPVLVGSLAAGIAAYGSVRFLDKHFRTKKTTPFGWYCLLLGLAMTIKLLVFP